MIAAPFLATAIAGSAPFILEGLAARKQQRRNKDEQTKQKAYERGEKIRKTREGIQEHINRQRAEGRVPFQTALPSGRYVEWANVRRRLKTTVKVAAITIASVAAILGVSIVAVNAWARLDPKAFKAFMDYIEKEAGPNTRHARARRKARAKGDLYGTREDKIRSTRESIQEHIRQQRAAGNIA